jgi:DGQHR domain-containing protein
LIKENDRHFASCIYSLSLNSPISVRQSGTTPEAALGEAKNMKTITIPALELRQNGTRLLITKMKAGDLLTFTKVDPYVTGKSFNDPSQGYQRPAEMPRIKKFANWLRKEEEEGGSIRVPSAILLSARGAEVVLSPNGTITLKSSNRLPLVDGQHRTEGFRYAIETKGMEELAEFEIPVVIMLDVDKVSEMRQFTVVNGTQKSVRTDLVNMILTQLSEHEGDEAVRGAEQWKVVVTHAVARLNGDSDGPWFDRIVMPDQSAYSKSEQETDPDRKHRRIVRATSFMTSLKPIESLLAEFFNEGEDLKARSEKLFSVVDSFWRAVRGLMPDCFEEADHFVLQKTPGIFALHRLCLRVMKDMFTGHRAWDEKNFAEVLENCAELSNPSYWAVGSDEGNRGDAAKYGSMKGFSELADLLYEDLRA